MPVTYIVTDNKNRLVNQIVVTSKHFHVLCQETIQYAKNTLEIEKSKEGEKSWREKLHECFCNNTVYFEFEKNDFRLKKGSNDNDIRVLIFLKIDMIFL